MLTTSDLEFAPSGDVYDITYVSNSEEHPRRFTTFLAGSSGTEIDPRFSTPINFRHSKGGSASIFGDDVAFEYKQDGDWDIGIYDRFFFQYVGTPRFLRTERDERAPSLSGEWWLFTRIRESRSRVLLFERGGSDDRRTLATAPRFEARSEQVVGNYAIYSKGRNVYVYDIAAEASVRFPKRGRGAYEAASVTSDGTAYAAHLTGNRCTGQGEIRRMDPDGTVTTIHEFARGKYVTSKTAAIETEQGTTILFDRFNCRTRDSNIYRLDDADSAG